MVRIIRTKYYRSLLISYAPESYSLDVSLIGNRTDLDRLLRAIHSECAKESTPTPKD